MSKITSIFLIVLFSCPQMEIQFLTEAIWLLAQKRTEHPVFASGFLPAGLCGPWHFSRPRTGAQMEEQRQERSSSPLSLFFTSSSRLPAVQNLRPAHPQVQNRWEMMLCLPLTTPHPSICPVSLCFSFLEEGTVRHGPSWHHCHLKASLPFPDWHVTI